jgi:DNA topoisomerase-1
MGEDFTAKDFRTWGGTLLAVDLLSAEAIEDSQKARKDKVNASVKSVAQRLGNTPAIARSSYINPRIFVRYMSGEDFNSVRQTIANMNPPKYISKDEYFALKILEAKS